MTNPRVPLQRSDDRAQRQNPCDTRRLLFLLDSSRKLEYHYTPQGIKRLLSSQAETSLKEKAAEAGISRKFKFYANVG